MRCLWLTWIDPKPEHDGQRIYSGRLIDAVAAAGAGIDVLCFSSDGSSRRAGTVESSVTWWPVAPQFRPHWASVLSPLPNIAYRCDTPSKRQVLMNLLSEPAWDAIVLDGLYTGWALPHIDRLFPAGGHRPLVVYVAHNHEESTRAGIARDYSGNPLTRALLRHDATKVRRTERRMVDRADLVTAITAEDASLFAERRPDKRLVVLPPGYAGRRVARRTITASLPRRVILVGSFGWFAKRMNLKSFLEIADPIFAEAGAELQVVGDGASEFLDGLRGRLKATQLVGGVASIEPYLAESRVAVVPERSGGGFKLKVLDYVFNRLPVAALAGTVAGTPLHSPESLLTFSDFQGLARGVIDVIDDLPLLNRIQEQAYAACAEGFDWRRRGQRFVEAIGTAA